MAIGSLLNHPANRKGKDGTNKDYFDENRNIEEKFPQLREFSAVCGPMN
ncbi:MAG: hypothetical protein OXF24_07515 [Hyphomicrobiales bacterium]|nr:hypothetical protein [Hyphomicrobiales bacterium]